MFRIFLIAGFTLFAPAVSAQSLSSSVPPDISRIEATRQKPDVSVMEQSGAPLRISLLKTKWATPDQQMLEIYAVVENASEMNIRAYALRSGVADNLQSIDPCLLHNVQSPGKILRPGDSDAKSMWRRISFDDQSKSIDLSLDFVEFANGATWGTDLCQSSERLSGLRAGALRLENNSRRCWSKTTAEHESTFLILRRRS